MVLTDEISGKDNTEFIYVPLEDVSSFPLANSICHVHGINIKFVLSEHNVIKIQCNLFFM